MIYFNGNFYDQIEDVIEDIDLESFDEAEVLKIENCTLEPIIHLDAEILVDRLEDILCDRHSENNATEEQKEIIEVLKRNINFEKLNSELPKLWFPNNTFETYSKPQILSLL